MASKMFQEEEMKLYPTKKGWVSGWLPWGRGDGSEMRTHQRKGNLDEVRPRHGVVVLRFTAGRNAAQTS